MQISNIDNLKKLKQLPIFNMSLSSKELFHSNFIAWVLETYPKQMGELFCNLLEIQPIFNISKLAREKQNIDISFYLGETIIFIENKVKSIAYKEQLEEYSSLYTEKAKKCILLSLKKPTFNVNEVAGWEYLEYGKLLEQFKIICSQNGICQYNKYLIEDYIKFMNILLEDLIPLFDIEKIQISNLYQKDTLENQLLNELAKLRMHDFFLKGLFENIANDLKKRVIHDTKFEICKDTMLKCKDKTFYIGFDMSRAQGILDVKYKINDIYIGIQIQGNQYRQCIEGSNKNNIEKLADRLITRSNWFNFDSVINNNPIIYPINESKKFNQFSSPSWLFLYRSIKISDFDNKTLLEMIQSDMLIISKLTIE